MSWPPRETGDAAGRKTFATLLMALGGVTALLSGLVTLAALFGALWDLMRGRWGEALAGLTGGLLPAAALAVGAGLVFVGNKLGREPESPNQAASAIEPPPRREPLIRSAVLKETGGVVANFFGMMLTTVGALIMLLSGLCSGVALIATLPTLFGAGSMIIWVAVIGGIPFGVGWLLFAVGKGLSPKPKTYLPRTPPPPEEGEL